jgi:hypothetical protein
MSAFNFPEPILDAREIDLLRKIADEYNKFTSPGVISKSIKAVGTKVAKIAPTKLLDMAKEVIDVASEWDYIKQVLEYTGKGFFELSKHSSRFTFSYEGVIKNLNETGCHLKNYEQICAIRSYQIESVISKRNYGDLIAAFSEGAFTGAPGFLGLPFNIALSFFLYFRAAQSIAIYYGYDVKNDPRELEFASEAMMMSLAPNNEIAGQTMGGLIGKMMLATNLTALRQALSKRTYTEMAKRGGAELLYVQIRALANKAAQNALKKAGKEGIEAGIFRKLLEQIGRRLPKEAGKKAIPFLGAIIGGFSDTYYMNRILTGSNLLYHKRFLFEKQHRVKILKGEVNNSRAIELKSLVI